MEEFLNTFYAIAQVAYYLILIRLIYFANELIEITIKKDKDKEEN